MGNHVNSRSGGRECHTCVLRQGPACAALTLPFPMACTRVSSAAPEHCPAALGEPWLGSSTLLFLLLKPPDHPRHSQVLSGVPRLVPQLSHPVPSGDLSISIPFLLFYRDWSCCDCNVRVHVWPCPAGSRDSWGNECWGAPRRIPCSTSGPAVPLGLAPAYGWIDLWWLSPLPLCF